jgi:hypothetical protein
VNRKLAKKAAEKKRTEPKRQALRRQAQTEWKPRDERDMEIEVTK